MKKNNIKQNINELNKIASKFPQSLNEALNFNESENDDAIVDDDFEDVPQRKIQHKEFSSDMSSPSEKAKILIDDIRKKSLRAMAELADTPDDENYIVLKKIWSMTDRKPEQDKNIPQ